MSKIRFSKEQHKDYYHELKNRVDVYVTKYGLLRRAQIILWIKLALYAALFVSSYAVLLFFQWENTALLVLNYSIFGLSGILLAFNAAHDSAHGTFTKSKTWNDIIFRFTFNINGVNGYLWKKRHVASHHLFPNVDGCDADIDENIFLRLSPSHKRLSMHKYQHLYATLLYMFYTLHWIFYKDFNYLVKSELSNMKNITHPVKEYIRFFLWKAIYFGVFLVIPILSGYDWQMMVLAFFIMHVVISLFFVWTLIISHLTIETAFPVQDESGVLPFNYYHHQLATSMDYRPRSIVMNWFLGGFNAHAAHHLFPKWPHTMNRHVTFIIQRTAVEFGLPYNSKTFVGALASHYRYLRKMGEER
ncbi:MAG: fatty acid desaturase family protein [Flavobacteriales bacterium]